MSNTILKRHEIDRGQRTVMVFGTVSVCVRAFVRMCERESLFLLHIMLYVPKLNYTFS